MIPGYTPYLTRKYPPYLNLVVAVANVPQGRVSEHLKIRIDDVLETHVADAARDIHDESNVKAIGAS